ncbi:ArsR/SmtB family transcription factor [Flaviflagellibacter deserti]|uniref:ArsR/SmtB family transcription factor n=1 Tax=Flaviflagellibacter deserti TaxID=2267266 RepID=A0ABV9Z5F5_9HYPH
MDKERALLALAALSQGTRFDTFQLLVRHEPDGLPAGEIARLLAIPQNTMSSHLAVLTRAGLAKAERQSRSIIYRADIAAFSKMTVFMLKDCCGGRAEICAPIITQLTPCCPEKEPIHG